MQIQDDNPTAHTGDCWGSAYDAAVENWELGTGKSLYDLPLDGGDGTSPFREADAEIKSWAVMYLAESTMDCRCPAARCTAHPAFEADYCPACGTARVIS
jgi:hypothetical protein